MLVKMQFLSITGPVNQIDRITQTYLEGREFHLENSFSELGIDTLAPFNEENPYKELLAQSQSLVGTFPHDQVVRPGPDHLDVADIKVIIHDLAKEVAASNDEKAAIQSKLSEVDHELENLRPYRTLNANLQDLQGFTHLIMRMGRMPVEQYSNFVSYIEDDLDAIFIKTSEDDEYVYGIYFTPKSSVKDVDEAMHRLSFAQSDLHREYHVVPSVAFDNLSKEKEDLEAQLEKVKNTLSTFLENHKDKLLEAHRSLIRLSNNFDIRNYAVVTEQEHQKFFVLCGWMPYDQAKEVEHLMNKDPDVYYETEMGAALSKLTPPSKIKNPKFFKPFESFIRMYGIPGYNEFDPTIFLAITYTVIFGMMYGDVGHGAVLIIGGIALYLTKKIDLAAIIACAGVFSVTFGFIYGSIFGFEDIIHPIWKNPMKDIPTVMIVSITFGIGLILFTMLLNIILKIKQKDWGALLFNQNGIAGLVFYGAVLYAVINALLGHPVEAEWLLGIIIVVPLLLIALQKPLGNMVKHKKQLIEGTKGNFFIESFFELFEILLSYITNTISFVRIGAFALSHAGMMYVVMELGHVAQGHPNWIIVVLGNLLVMALEGLIVGIQVLRLEYYELFSRFYSGNGREFHSYLK